MKAPPRRDNTDFVMFLRAIAFNAVCVALVFWIYQGGRINTILSFDTLYISRIIAGLGILGLITITIRIFKISRELNVVKKYRELMNSDNDRKMAEEWLQSTNSHVAKFISGYRRVLSDDKSIFVGNFQMIISSKLSIFGSITDWLTTLGLLGTVVGFRIALEIMAGIKDIGLLVTFIQSISGGLMIAIDTTIVGICAAIWLDVNLKWVLRPGAVQLVSEAVNAVVLYHE